MNPAVVLDVNDEKMCRLCHDTKKKEKVIAPCSCAGSMQWVHRSCLNTWRAVSPNPDHFSHCDVCAAEFKVRVREDKNDKRKLFFCCLLTRDCCLLFIFVNLMILGIGAIVQVTGLSEKIVSWMDDGVALMDYFSDPVLKIFYVYAFGFVGLLIALGVIACVVGCSALCGDDDAERNVSVVNATMYPYHSNCGDCYFIYCAYPYHCGGRSHGRYNGSCGGGSCGGNNCNCSGGSGKVDGDLAAVCVVIFLIVLVVIILMGLVFGLFLLTTVVVAIVRRHMHVLQRKRDAEVYEVVCLQTENTENAMGATSIQPHTIVTTSEPLVKKKGVIVV